MSIGFISPVMNQGTLNEIHFDMTAVLRDGSKGLKNNLVGSIRFDSDSLLKFEIFYSDTKFTSKELEAILIEMKRQENINVKTEE